MHRRSFVRTLGAALGAAALLPVAACGTAGAAPRAASAAPRRLKRVGIQLYTLRDAARGDLERTLADIAAIGYRDVELLGSMRNFGMAPARLRAVLDRLGLRAPSTHVGAGAFDDLDRQLDDARTLGHEYLTVANFPADRRRTLDDVRRWGDRFNEAGAIARRRGVWIGFHNHAEDFTPIDGQAPYDVLVERTDPSVVRLQLDTGNLAMAGRDPQAYMTRFGARYWSFHVKDVPRMHATSDAELGKGILDFRRLLASIPRIDDKHLFVEQETYPGAPLDSARRDYGYLAALEF
jgi:sugar phosphate isomerase/epimerase